MNTDPIADMLTRLRNAIAARHESATLPHSKIKEAIAGILKTNRFIDGFRVEGQEPFRKLVIDISSSDGLPSISELSRISKPGRRIYAKADEIPTVMSGRGIVIISTSSGMMTGKEAKKRGLGGELICRIW